MAVTEINKRKCMIIGAAGIRDEEIFNEYKPDEHYIICADAGFETALEYSIIPDLIVGDFDSATKPIPNGIKVIELPEKKDVTDTMYAAMTGVKLGFSDFVFIGCLGGKRFDHSIANLEVLEYLSNHVARGTIAQEETRIVLVKSSRLKIVDSVGSTLSVFPYNGSDCTVSYKGLEYPLNFHRLSVAGNIMGVSNSVVANPAYIDVHTGTALVIMYTDKDKINQ